MDVRVARSRAAVLSTATDLLVEGGPSAVTIEAIVARSGVAKSTIYRHWDSRNDVLLAVIEGCAPRIEPPEEPFEFEQALRDLVEAFRRMLNDPHWARVLPALLALRNQQHGIADLEQRIEKRQDHAIEVVVRRGIEEGVLAPDIDVDQASALLVGPLFVANLTSKPALDDAFCDLVIRGFLRTYAVPAVTV